MSGESLAILLAMILFGGCLAAPAPAAVSPPGSAPGVGVDGMPLPPLALAGNGCTWGGGHSIHTFQLADIVPEPWRPADVVEDVGPQLSYSDAGEQVFGIPTTGWGNWHTNFVCQGWTLDGNATPLTLGMVLTRIEPPPFDAAPVHRNYIVNVIASDNAVLNDRLMMDGWMSMSATGQLAWDGTTFHHVLATHMHGTYESLFRTRDVGAFKDDVVRLWFQKPNAADKTFSPVAADIHITAAKPPTHTIADPDGYFSHSGTDDHVLVAGQPQGVAGQIAGFVVSGFDASFAWGPAPPVKLEKEYSHL